MFRDEDQDALDGAVLLDYVDATGRDQSVIIVQHRPWRLPNAARVMRVRTFHDVFDGMHIGARSPS